MLSGVVKPSEYKLLRAHKPVTPFVAKSAGAPKAKPKPKLKPKPKPKPKPKKKRA